MGVSGGPNMIEDGLVFAVDASDLNSYNPTENLLYYTSQVGTQIGVYYGTGSTTPLSMSLNAAIAPDGTNTATILNQSASNTNEYIFGLNGVYSTILDTNSIYTYSVYAKPGTKNNFSFTIDENSFGGKRYRFDYYFPTKELYSSYAGIGNNGLILDSGSTEVGNGWVKIYGTFLTSTGSVTIFVDMMGRFGNGTGSVFIWGRQLEKKSKPTNYTEITTSPITGSKIWNSLASSNYKGTLSSASYNNNGRGSFFFNGQTGSVFVNVGSEVLQDSGGSVSAWVYPSSLVTPGYIFSAFGTNNDRFYINYNSGQFTVARGNPITSVGVGTPPTGSWYNVALTWNSSSLYGYLNGTFISSASYVANGTVSIFALGGYVNTQGTQAFSGSISSTHIYNRTLSASEILQNYNAVKSRFNL